MFGLCTIQRSTGRNVFFSRNLFSFCELCADTYCCLFLYTKHLGRPQSHGYAQGTHDLKAQYGCGPHRVCFYCFSVVFVFLTFSTLYAPMIFANLACGLLDSGSNAQGTQINTQHTFTHVYPVVTLQSATFCGQ